MSKGLSHDFNLSFYDTSKQICFEVFARYLPCPGTTTRPYNDEAHETEADAGALESVALYG